MSEYPKVNLDNCVGCQSCQGACPVGDSLWKFNDDSKAVFQDDSKDQCIQCRACESNCPAAAITFE